MIAKIKNAKQLGFYSTFEEQLNYRHQLYILSHQINWQLFEEAFADLYSEEGRPAKPIRLMVSLLMLKHIILQQDHRLSRNFYKGIKGDNINVMLAAAGMNFKRMMNKWKNNPLLFLIRFFQTMLHRFQSVFLVFSAQNWLFKG